MSETDVILSCIAFPCCQWEEVANVAYANMKCDCEIVRSQSKIRLVWFKHTQYLTSVWSHGLRTMDIELQ